MHYYVAEAPVEPDMEQKDWIKIGKECGCIVYHHLAYLTNTQRTSHEMLGWMNHELELRLLGKLSICR